MEASSWSELSQVLINRTVMYVQWTPDIIDAC